MCIIITLECNSRLTICIVCVYVCICKLCMHSSTSLSVDVYACICPSMWRLSQVNTGCPPSILTFFFKTRSVTGPGFLNSAELAGWQAPGILLPPSTGIIGEHCMSCFYTQTLGIWTVVLGQQALYQVSVSLAPCFGFLRQGLAMQPKTWSKLLQHSRCCDYRHELPCTAPFLISHTMTQGIK